MIKYLYDNLITSINFISSLTNINCVVVTDNSAITVAIDAPIEA